MGKYSEIKIECDGVKIKARQYKCKVLFLSLTLVVNIISMILFFYVAIEIGVFVNASKTLMKQITMDSKNATIEFTQLVDDMNMISNAVRLFCNSTRWC